MSEPDAERVPGSPDWLLNRDAAGPRPDDRRAPTGVGWKVASFVFGTSTVVLAILLSGQLAAPRPTTQDAPPATTLTPSPTASEAPQISDVSQLVGAFGLVLMQHYSIETGWPTSIDVIDGKAVTNDGVELGVVPDDMTLTYVLADDGSSFILTLEDAAGNSAVFGPASTSP
jgi:hypothetical protein